LEVTEDGREKRERKKEEANMAIRCFNRDCLPRQVFRRKATAQDIKGGGRSQV